MNYLKFCTIATLWEYKIVLTQGSCFTQIDPAHCTAHHRQEDVIILQIIGNIDE